MAYRKAAASRDSKPSPICTNCKLFVAYDDLQYVCKAIVLGTNPVNGRPIYPALEDPEDVCNYPVLCKDWPNLNGDCKYFENKKTGTSPKSSWLRCRSSQSAHYVRGLMTAKAKGLVDANGNPLPQAEKHNKEFIMYVFIGFCIGTVFWLNLLL